MDINVSYHIWKCSISGILYSLRYDKKKQPSDVEEIISTFLNSPIFQ